MEKTKNLISESSEVMTEMQGVIYQVETFLSENYQFRRNLLSGKTEMAPVCPGKEAEPEYDDGFQCYTWENERSISVNNRTCAEGIDRVRLYPEYQCP